MHDCPRALGLDGASRQSRLAAAPQLSGVPAVRRRVGVLGSPYHARSQMMSGQRAPTGGASRRHYAAGFKWIQWRTRGTMDRSPNDDRSDSMNPNNDAYDASEENREEQLAENEKD